MSPHPNAIRLEAFACGEDAPGVDAHLAECDACRVYVERARGITRELPKLDLGRARPRRSVMLASSVLVPLAVAAGALVSVLPRDRAPAAPVGSTSAGELAPPFEPETTFKGGLQLAVVRERDGRQERFTSTVRVRPGDRLRVEVALDRPRTILGAVLGDDGSYLEVMSDGARGAGTHLSERSARVDAQPLHGTILVGSPDAVRRARATGKLEDLTTLRVEWEPLP